MPRTLWKGTLSFGLVSIPVGVYTATEDKSPRFNQLRRSDSSRIGYKRVAKADDAEVSNDEIVKGYEYAKDSYVTFEPDELAAMKPPSSRIIEIQQFVPLAQIDPIYYDRPYYLAPEETGVKAYALLRRAMADADTVAICRITMRDKEHIATLRFSGDVLVLETMHWPDEIRPFSLKEVGIEEVPEPREQEVAMARSLIANLTEDFDPTAYTDTYRRQVLEAVEAKVQGQEITIPEEVEEAPQVVDLMAALKASVEATKGKKAS